MSNFFTDETIISKFNEGSLQMQRIHMLQERVNLSNLNPLNFYPESNFYGYQVIFNSLNSLFAECSSKLDDKEVEEGKTMRRRINMLLIIRPVHHYIENPVTHTKEIKVNQQSWRIIKEMLFEYELLIRKLLEVHNLTSPKVESEGGFD